MSEHPPDNNSLGLCVQVAPFPSLGRRVCPQPASPDAHSPPTRAPAAITHLVLLTRLSGCKMHVEALRSPTCLVEVINPKGPTASFRESALEHDSLGP